MNKPMLYLMVGYPGAGKTTLSKLITKHTEAIHIWADAERHRMVEKPTHSRQESLALYNELNKKTASLLAQGKSVVFDTNFNYKSDRQKLATIAKNYNSECLIVWVDTDIETARHNAVHKPELRNGYPYGMTEKQFDSIVEKLEPPQKDENYIKIDRKIFDPSHLPDILTNK